MSHDVTCVSAISAYVKETPSALQRRAETRTRFGQWFVEFVELVEPSSCAACAAISIDAGPEPQGLQSLHKQLLSTLKNWKETRGPAPMAPQRKTKYEILVLVISCLEFCVGEAASNSNRSASSQNPRCWVRLGKRSTIRVRSHLGFTFNVIRSEKMQGVRMCSIEIQVTHSLGPASDSTNTQTCKQKA